MWEMREKESKEVSKGFAQNKWVDSSSVNQIEEDGIIKNSVL